MALARTPKKHLNLELGIDIYAPKILNTTNEILKGSSKIIEFKTPINEGRINEYLNAIRNIKQGLNADYIYNANYKINKSEYDLKGYFNFYMNYIAEINSEGEMVYNFRKQFKELEEDVLRKDIENRIEAENKTINDYTCLIKSIEELEEKGYNNNEFLSDYGFALNEKIKLMKNEKMPDFMIEEVEDKLHKI